MPDVIANIEHLANLPLYNVEKPYLCLLPAREGFNPDTQRVDNLEFEFHSEIRITDIRGREDEFNLRTSGFQVVNNDSKLLKFESVDDVNAYKRETEKLLCEQLGGVHSVCYELRTRKNVPIRRNQFDINDPLLVEGPARGAHNDITFESGPAIIDRYLSAEAKERFFKPGYRFRIVNTWRPLIPVLEDRPLALCDCRSVDPDDLIAADRILPDRVGEVYYLRHNKQQRWCWLEKQTSSELFVFVMYDTMAGNQARLCPHVSFKNPRAPSDAPPRQSVETRSIVISEE